MPHWLTIVDVPLFISHMRLTNRRTLPTARGSWALDSGAFSQIAARGEFTDTPAQYVDAIRRYYNHIGRLEWAAPQDHMCESWILARSRIANSVADAQRWTVDNYRRLVELDPLVPIVPVLQGQTLDDYRRHIDLYHDARIQLPNLVGVGSVCRRQATGEIANLVAHLSTGLALHGFGVKSDGLRRYGWCLASADSMAWSYHGRRIRPCPHTGVTSCANCLPHALAWRDRAVAADNHRPVQLEMWR